MPYYNGKNSYVPIVQKELLTHEHSGNNVHVNDLCDEFLLGRIPDWILTEQRGGRRKNPLLIFVRVSGVYKGSGRKRCWRRPLWRPCSGFISS